MKLSLPIISLVLVALGAVDARPAFSLSNKRNANVAEEYAKRQTSREKITMRLHVKDTVKRVQDHLKTERQTATRNSVYNAPDRRGPLLPRASDDGTGNGRKRNVNPNAARGALLPRASDDGTGTGRRRRRAVIDDEPLVEDKREAKAEAAAEAPEEKVKARSDDPRQLDARGYPRCQKSGARTGYAHYPGWKLVGDDLSGGIPVSPESACVQACNKYGGACSGIFFDQSLKRCFLKGVHTSAWDFELSSSSAATDLVGGCALWANVVPEEMDAVCCRD